MPFDDTAVNSSRASAALGASNAQSASVGQTAPLGNVILFSELIERVMNRSPGLPGLATFHGPSGYGKSRAAVWGAHRYRAYYVEVKSLWTRKSLCVNILKELGIGKPASSGAEMLEQIAEQLVLSKRPLIVDEADYLCTKSMIEVIRDIYESSGAPIILIGEEKLPTKLKPWERVHGRMLDWVAAQPASLEEAEALAGLYATGVAVAPDLLAAIYETSAGSTRRICINLDRVREIAQTAGLPGIGLAQWREFGGEFYTGNVPGVRRIG